MKKKFAIGFLLLILISIVIWIIGALTEAVVPWFNNVRLDRIGKIASIVTSLGEILGWAFIAFIEWLYNSDRQKNKNTIWNPGEKKYGNKKSQN